MASRITRRRFLRNSAVAAGATVTAGSILSHRMETVAASSEKDTITLQVMIQDGMNPTTVADFEMLNPGIKIQWQVFSQTKFNAMLAAGSPPDVVRVDAVTQLPNILAQGLATNLEPYFAKNPLLKTSNLQPITNLYRWDGKKQGAGPIVGLPKDFSVDSEIWINEKVFDKAKVPYPSATVPMSYDELLALAKKLTVRKNGRIAVYGLDMFYVAGWYNAYTMQMVHQQGGSVFNSDLTECDYTTPEAKKALKWFTDWAQAHVGPSSLDPGDNPFGLAGVDRMAMTMLGYWFQGGFLSSLGAAENHWRLLVSPQMGSKRVTCNNTCTGVWIPKQSQHKDAAWKFVEWYTVGHGAHERAIVGDGIPPLKSMYALLPTKTAENKAALATMNADLAYFSLWHFSPYIDSSAAEQIWEQYMNQAFAGKMSVDAAAGAITQDINRQLKRNKKIIG